MMWLLLVFTRLVQATLRYREDPTFLSRGLPSEVSGVSAVAFDPMFQEVYVLQRSKNYPPVLVYDTAGNWLRNWGGINETRMFEKEHGIYIQPNHGSPIVWVTDSLNCTVQSFDISGNRLNILGSPGVCDSSLKPLHFGFVADVTSDESGNIYVSDGDGGVNNRVVKLDQNLRLVWSIGSLGTGPGEFHSPHSIAYDRGLLYVADRENHRTQVLTTDGKYLKEWDGGGVCNPRTPWSVRVDHSRALLFLVDAGYQPGPPTQGHLIVFDVYGDNCSAVSGLQIGNDISEPHEIAYDEATMDLYVAFINDNYSAIVRYVPTVPPSIV